jgi:hypothetical protein
MAQETLYGRPFFRLERRAAAYFTGIFLNDAAPLGPILPGWELMFLKDLRR